MAALIPCWDHTSDLSDGVLRAGALARGSGCRYLNRIRCFWLIDVGPGPQNPKKTTTHTPSLCRRSGSEASRGSFMVP